MTTLLVTAKNKVKRSEIVRYGIIGGMTQMIDICTYAFLVHFGVYYVIADIINNPLSLGFNYLGHKYFTFQKKNWNSFELGRYILTLIFNYTYTTIILIVFVDILHLSPVYGKLGQVAAIIFINYFVLKLFVFFFPSLVSQLKSRKKI